MRIVGRLERNGQIIVDDVEFDLHVQTPPDGLSSWRGSFTAAHEYGFEPGQLCRIVFEDGRAGDLYIEQVVIRGGSQTSPVRFLGTGPLA